MSRILDLKKRKVVLPEPTPVPVSEPIAQTAQVINQEIAPTLARQNFAEQNLGGLARMDFPNEIITDSGARLPFHKVSWVGPLAHRNEGTGIPYVLGAVLVVVGILIAIYQRNWIAATLFIGMGIMTAVHAWNPHPHIPIEISPVSIKLGDRQYSHTDVHSFWIHHDLPHGSPELSLHLKQWYMPYIKIPLYDQDPSQIRMVLLEYIPEIEHDDPAMHRFLKHLGI